MDRRERMDDPLVMLRAALSGWQADLWTALPATVSSFSAGPPATVQAQPTVQAQVRTPGGTWINATLPLCVDCPVVFPGGGGFTLTFPVAAGDEGLLVFASRCIDSWWQNGGVQPQAEFRMHDLSDGFYFPTGGMSKVVSPVSPASLTKVQLRNAAGTQAIELDPATSRCNILSVGGLWVNGVEVVVP